LIAGAKLLELVDLSSDYENMIEKLKVCKPLDILSEETLFLQYKSGIRISGKKPFQNFKKENIEAFYRLKLRLIEERLYNEPNMVKSEPLD